MYSQETRIYVALLAGMIVLLFLMAFFIITIIRYQRKKAVYDRGTIKLQFKYLEAEKERIAIDLHDDIGASLSAVKMRLQFVLSEDKSIQQNIDISEKQIDVIMEKLRTISQNMMPSILKRKGLKEAFAELVDQMIHAAGIKIYFSSTEIQMEKETEVQLYRIGQEILNNIIKHSGATVVNFNLEQGRGFFSLHISDNGKGFKKNDVIKDNKGTGLKNIMARVDIIKAKIYLTTSPGEGVDYLIKINCL